MNPAPASFLLALLAAVPLHAVTYEQDFDNFPDGATILGDGTQMAGTARVVGRALELTRDGVAGGGASFSVPALGGSSTGWIATFDLTIYDSAGNNEPADGMSFNYGNAALGTLGGAEEGMVDPGSGLPVPGVTQNLSFEIDTWMNSDAEQGVNISGIAAGSDMGQLAFTNGRILADGTTVGGPVTVSWDPVGGASFSTAGLLTNAAFSNIGTGGFVGNDLHTFILSARVGGANETLVIDNLTIITQGSSDNDGDGLPNDWELDHGLDPESSVGDEGAGGDPDGDDLTNLEEWQLGTDPQDEDTDGDALLDGDEVAGGTDPDNADTDSDGLEDGAETNTGAFVHSGDTGTDPTVADTDGDGVGDGQEVAAGRDPTVAEPVGDILITEFMASNASGLQDFEGDYSDWIEIYNNGDFTIDLAGWHLTDNAGDLTKWTFPARVLDPGGFLIVFASDKNLAGPELHANFRLSAGGEYLALVQPDGVTVSHEFAPAFPPQLTDASFGLEMLATETALVAPGSAGRSLIPAGGSLGTTWTGIAFNDGAWASGTNGFGYDAGGTFGAFLGTNIMGAMKGTNPGAYLRFPFTIAGAPDFDALRLDMTYDDGFALFLNGTPIGDANAPVAPAWNATALAENAGGLVVANFAAPEAFALANHSGTPASIIAGADPHLRLVYNGTGSNHNSVHFNRTDPGPFGPVVAEFDFRMNGTADGFSFLMLPTGTYGTTTASPALVLGTAEEPNVANTFAVGFDIYSNVDETSIHFGSTRAESNRQGTINLNANVWHRALIQVVPAVGGGSNVSVGVIPNVRGTPGATVVFHNNVAVPDLNPYEYRVQFSARTGGETTNVDLDNISVTRSGAGGALTLEQDLSEQLGLLQPGANVLAVHGLNITAGDSDFLARPVLRAVKVESVDPATVFYYEAPTPGSPNVAGTLNGLAGPVTISPGSRTFNTSLNVTLTTATSGGEIRYTTDGSLPTQASTLYTGPVALVASTRLRARAFVPNFSPGPVASATFFRLESDLQAFSSNLPIVVVDNFGAGGFPGAGGAFQPMVMAVFDRQPGTGRSAMTNVPQLVTRGGAHDRGSSTAGQSKRNLRIETWGEEDQVDVGVDLLDFPSDSDFILYAPYDFDRALMRNAFMYRLSNELGRYAVRTRFVEVFANTGGGNLSYVSDYHGVYILMEAVKRDKDRVDITKLGPGDNAAPEVTGGYLWKVDRGSPAFTTVGLGDQQVIEDPDSGEITGAQNACLRAHLNAFGTALTGGSFTDPLLGYAPYIDQPSWIDHHMLNVLAFNVDALRLSTYLHKDRNQPIVKGPVWDFDRSLASYDGRDDNPQTWGDTGGTNFFQHGWFNRLFDDPDFAQQWIDRWCALRQPGGTFSDAHLAGVLDAMRAELAEAAPRNYARWTSVPPSNGGSLAGEVQNIRNWLALRAAWYDAQFAGVAGFSQSGGVVPSGFQVTLSPPPASSVRYRLDGGDPRGDGGAFAGTLYAGPITLTQSARLVTRAYKAGNPTALFDSRWGCPKEAVFLVGSQPAVAGTLVISEVHYHPAPPTAAEIMAGFVNDDDFEFIELLNIGAQTVDLVDCRFDDGIEFVFPLNATVAAGQRILLAKNPAAFALRYGGGLNVAGGYAAGSLNNDGEHLRLLDWNGAVLAEFTYNDAWYRPADGDGYSLELRDPATPPAQWSAKASWAISGDFHGTPGYASEVFGQAFAVWLEDFFTAPEIGDSSVSGPLVDLDGDGLNTLLEYAFDLDPHSGGPAGAPVAGLADGRLTISFTRWKNAVDLTYAAEASGDLSTWTEVTGVVGTPHDNGDGTETVTITDTEALADGARRFIRILVAREG